MYSGSIRDWPKRVCFGPGSIARLPRLMAALGEKLAGVFDEVPAHSENA